MILNLVRSVAHYFRINAKTANSIIEIFQAVVEQWPTTAAPLGIPPQEQKWMAQALKLAGKRRNNYPIQINFITAAYLPLTLAVDQSVALYL